VNGAQTPTVLNRQWQSQCNWEHACSIPYRPLYLSAFFPHFAAFLTNRYLLKAVKALGLLAFVGQASPISVSGALLLLVVANLACKRKI